MILSFFAISNKNKSSDELIFHTKLVWRKITVSSPIKYFNALIGSYNIDLYQ